MRAGVSVGDYSKRVREHIWSQVEDGLEDGIAVMAWRSSSKAGVEFVTLRNNRRRGDEPCAALAQVAFPTPVKMNRPS